MGLHIFEDMIIEDNVRKKSGEVYKAGFEVGMPTAL